MSTSIQARDEAAGAVFRTAGSTKSKAWVAKAAKQPISPETIDPGPEALEVAVEYCGLCLDRLRDDQR